MSIEKITYNTPIEYFECELMVAFELAHYQKTWKMNQFPDFIKKQIKKPTSGQNKYGKSYICYKEKLIISGTFYTYEMIMK